MKIRFYKDIDNCWYADLPDWKGDKWELEMVCGADEMLNILAQGENEVFTEIEFDAGEYKLSNPKVVLKKDLEPPICKGWYKTQFNPEISLNLIWLCGVTEFVFGYYPDEIRIY